jgi:hypothetical protein
MLCGAALVRAHERGTSSCPEIAGERLMVAEVDPTTSLLFVEGPFREKVVWDAASFFTWLRDSRDQLVDSSIRYIAILCLLVLGLAWVARSEQPSDQAFRSGLLLLAILIWLILTVRPPPVLVHDIRQTTRPLAASVTCHAPPASSP